MKTEKKIFLEKDETLEDIIKHLSHTSATKVILNVPNDSAMASSVENFHALAAAAEKRKKTLFIESVDDRVVELAALAQISAVNPIFKSSERTVSDIMPRRTGVKKTGKRREVIEKEVKSIKKQEEEPEEEPPKENKEEGEVKITVSEERKSEVLHEIFETPREAPKEKERRERRKAVIFRRPKTTKGFFVGTVITLAIIFAGGWLVLFGLPKATITLTLKKTTVPLDMAVLVESSVTSPDITTDPVSIPGEMLSSSKNLQMEFTASTTAVTSQKAKGLLTIYNAFNSQPQTLVATTRFMSPDGKIVRLDSRVTVPAAKVQNGTIVPSSVQAAVTADGVGTDYNFSAGTKWTIPGFEGTSKYKGFYAINENTLSGGAIGEHAAPTQDDESLAKAKTEAALRDALSAEMQLLMAKNLKLLDGAISFSITKETIQPVQGETNKFSVYAEATMKEFVFDEDMLKQALIDKLKQNLTDNVEAIGFDVSYGTPQVDFEKETMRLSTSGSAVFAVHVDTAALANTLVNQDESAVRRTIFSLPGLETANVTLWPFWVHQVPSDPGKVKISVQ